MKPQPPLTPIEEPIGDANGSWYDGSTRVERRIGRVRRPAQFAAIGAGCAAVQFGLLIAFNEGTSLGSLSNAVAFLISAELNFALNIVLTWGDRVARGPMASFVRFFGFNLLTLVAVSFNQAIYVVALHFVPYLVAAALGLAFTTVAKYFVADRWIFRKRGGASASLRGLGPGVR